MSDFVLQNRVDWIWRVVLGQSVVLLFLIFSFIDVSFLSSSGVKPYFILLLIYYWSIHRPTFLNPIFIFFVGIFFDVIHGFPIGIHSLIFLVVQIATLSQRHFLAGQTYLVIWIGFFVTCFSVLITEWLFFSFLNQYWLELMYFIKTLFVTVLFFPLITLIFSILQKILPVPQRTFL